MDGINFCPRCGAAMTEADRFGKLRPTCPACGYVHFFDPKVAAAVFVEDAGRVLLIRRAVAPEIGKWALPAGYVDRGEDPRTTAVREALEETGLTVRLTGLLDVFYNGARGNGVGADIILVYAAEVVSGVLTPLDDADAADWFSPRALPELAFESTQTLIAAWQQGR